MKTIKEDVEFVKGNIIGIREERNRILGLIDEMIYVRKALISDNNPIHKGLFKFWLNGVKALEELKKRITG
jgi:hypothetical protein